MNTTKRKDTAQTRKENLMASISDLYDVSHALQVTNERERSFWVPRAQTIVNGMIEKAQEKARKAAEKRKNMSDEEREAINNRRRVLRQRKNHELYKLIKQATDAVITSTPRTGSTLYKYACEECPELAHVVSRQSFIQRICDDDNCINPAYRHRISGLKTILYYKEG